MTVPWLTIKVKTWMVDQFLEILTLSLQWLTYSFHSLAYEITQRIKPNNPVLW